MNRSLKIKLAAGILCAASCQLYASPALVVRVYNTSSASPRDLDEMKESASQVFNRAGIDVEWSSCTPGPRHSAVCPDSGGSAGRTTIFLHLIDQRLRTLLGRADHRTSSVLIFYETACVIERNTNGIVTKGQILGHGLAHEIGHLLLASDTHASTGIMKESYSRSDILTMGQGRLLFSDEESRLLRERVFSASASATALPPERP